MTSQKLFWASNLKFLRLRRKLSQDELAGILGITRVKLNSHENGTSKNPPLEDLLNLSTFYKLAIDTLLKVDLSRLTELKIRELEAGNDVYLSGGKIRVLSISVNQANRENVEYVPLKAKAGYRDGYSDPEYIAALPKFTFPHLSDKKTYRVFPTEGDSMLPIPENCLVITEYVTDWRELKKETKCIVILRNEQKFLFKEVSHQTEANMLLLHSLNPAYSDQEVFAGDVLELWQYHSYITDVLPSAGNIMDEILRTVNEISVDVKKLAS
jgi:transcriptional regulator with XRE-family HTH domain